MKLTIGMACYRDFPGVYFTVQALRAYHNLDDTEILVVDNGGNGQIKVWIDAWMHGQVRYVEATEIVGTTWPRQRVFEEARGEYVICVDNHVLLLPGSLDRLWEGDDLIHGVMYYDCLTAPVTHMDDIWRAHMWGVWCEKPLPLGDEPIEIGMHGLGLFGCKKSAWLGFNKEFRGFGGEEGYIHTKFRQAGRKVILLPWMKWVHKFRGNDVPYPLEVKDRVRNYLLGFKELGLDIDPIVEHFGVRLVKEAMP